MLNSIVLRMLFFIILLSFSNNAVAQSESEIKFYRDNGIQPLLKSLQHGNFAPGTYLIPHDIMIEEGKTMTIFPGSTILFSQDAMLVVNGNLVCSGSTNAPIVFKRLDNQLYFNPLDPRLDTRWDGIYLPDAAKLEMSNTVISDSKYGIVVSGKKVEMVLDSVRFINNKFQNVKIGEQMMKIDQDSPVVFRYPEQEGVFIPPVSVINATETIQDKKGSPHQTAYPKLRIGMGVAGGIGVLAAITGVILFTKYDSDYSKSHKNSDLNTSNAGMIIAATGAFMFGVGTAGFAWTFFY